MAARARQAGDTRPVEQVDAQLERPRPTVVSDNDGAAPSPALMLQRALHEGLAEPRIKKWPPIATLGFILATCGGFWAAVAFGAAQLLK